MRLLIGNAPCSWGVEFANDHRNPSWTACTRRTAAAGYAGIELGPIGYMPESPGELAAALDQRNLTLTAGVIFQPFHDPAKWEQLCEIARRTAHILLALGVPQIVLVDSISPHRVKTAGRPGEADRLQGPELDGLLDRIRTSARMATEEYGLSASFHAHAAGFVEFEDEIECVLDAIEPDLLGICLDTGHCTYAGFDPVDFYKRHADRVTYLHFKDVNPEVKAHVIEHRVGFYDDGHSVCSATSARVRSTSQPFEPLLPNMTTRAGRPSSRNATRRARRARSQMLERTGVPRISRHGVTETWRGLVGPGPFERILYDRQEFGYLPRTALKPRQHHHRPSVGCPFAQTHGRA